MNFKELLQNLSQELLSEEEVEIPLSSKREAHALYVQGKRFITQNSFPLHLSRRKESLFITTPRKLTFLKREKEAHNG